MKYLYALCTGLHPIIWARGWQLWEWLNSKPESSASGSGSFSERISDRTAFEHLRRAR